MRRTHVMHKRDNRRAYPSHYMQRDPHDRRPALAWLRDGERQIMTLDGAQVATVEPTGETVMNGWDFDPVHAALIHGEPFEARRTFPTCDAARGFCESAFARGSSASSS